MLSNLWKLSYIPSSSAYSSKDESHMSKMQICSVVSRVNHQGDLICFSHLAISSSSVGVEIQSYMNKSGQLNRLHQLSNDVMQICRCLLRRVTRKKKPIPLPEVEWRQNYSHKLSLIKLWADLSLLQNQQLGHVTFQSPRTPICK
jgi:hypothetical protein